MVAAVFCAMALFLLFLKNQSLQSVGVIAVGVWTLYAATVFIMPIILERLLLMGLSVLQFGWVFQLIQLTHLSQKVFLFALMLGGLLMGLGLSAMNVGHSYLSSQKLKMDPLKRVTSFLFYICILKLLLVLGFVLFKTPPEMTLNYFLNPQNMMMGVALILRVLFGFLGTLILTGLALETIKIDSTQSATGILYSVLFMILVGEGAAIYLMVEGKWVM